MIYLLWLYQDKISIWNFMVKTEELFIVKEFEIMVRNLILKSLSYLVISFRIYKIILY